MEAAIKEFIEKVQQVTGRPVRVAEIERFIDQAETAIAHHQARIVQIGFGDWATVSGRAELIEVAF